MTQIGRHFNELRIKGVNTNVRKMDTDCTHFTSLCYAFNITTIENSLAKCWKNNNTAYCSRHHVAHTNEPARVLLVFEFP